MGHLRITIGYHKVTVVHIRVTLGHLGVTLGHLRVRLFFSIGKHEANTTELHPKVRQTCYLDIFIICSDHVHCYELLPIGRGCLQSRQERDLDNVDTWVATKTWTDHAHDT